MKPTSIIFLVLSVILIATGYVSMQMAVTLAENENIALYSDDLDEDGNRIGTVYYNSLEHDKIEVSVSDATVYLRQGDEEKVVFKNYTEGSYTAIKSGVSYVISDNLSAIDMITSGKFNLTFKGLRHYWHDREILSRPKEVWVYTTENTVLTAVDLKLASGTVNIKDYKVNFDVMSSVESGKIEASSCEAASFNLGGENCIVNADKLIAPRFHSDIKSGKVTMKNCDITSLTQIKVKEEGEVAVDLGGEASEYNIVAYASKNVTINGKNVGTQYPPKKEVTDGEETDNDANTNTGNKTIDINVLSGTVSIKTK